MKAVNVARENWPEVAEAIAKHGVFMAVRVVMGTGTSYDLSIGNTTYRLPEDLAQDLVDEDALSPTTYARMYLVGFRKRR